MGLEKKGRSKGQLIALIIVVVVCVAFAVYSYVWGRGYYNAP